MTLGTGRIRGVSPIQTQRPPRQGAPLRTADRARGGARATRGRGGLVGRAGGQIVAPSSAGSANGSGSGSGSARRNHKVDHSRALRALGLGGMRGRDESSAPSGGLGDASVSVLSAADRTRSAPTNLRHTVRVLNARASALCPHLVAAALPIMSYRVTDMYLVCSCLWLSERLAWSNRRVVSGTPVGTAPVSHTHVFVAISSPRHLHGTQPCRIAPHGRLKRWHRLLSPAYARPAAEPITDAPSGSAA